MNLQSLFASFRQRLRLCLRIGLCLCWGFAGCGGESRETAAKDTPPLKMEQPAPPAAESRAPLAVRVTQETRDTYQWYCGQCHGLEGKGNGINAPFLTVPPRDHTKAEYMETRTDLQLFEAIKFGGLHVGRAPCMPRWGHTLDDGAIQSLVAYVRELCQCEAL